MPRQFRIPYLRTLTSRLSAPDTETHFMRFSIFRDISDPPENSHPILAIGSAYSKIYFWDLKRLEEYYHYTASIPAYLIATRPSPSYSTIFGLTSGSSTPNPSEPLLTTQPKRPPFLHPSRARGPRIKPTNANNTKAQNPSDGNNSFQLISSHALSRLREASPSASSIATSTTATDSNSHLSIPQPSNPPSTQTPTTRKDIETWDKKYAITDPLAKLLPHKEEVVKGLGFLGRQVAWSNGGEYCVVVGTMRASAVFQRWEKK